MSTPIVTRDDFPDMVVEHAASGELMINFRDVTRGMMAREKVLYDGHPVAAEANRFGQTVERRAALKAAAVAIEWGGIAWLRLDGHHRLATIIRWSG